jgi:hypothetical protein
VGVAVITVISAIFWRTTEHFSERGIQRVPRQLPRKAVR